MMRKKFALLLPLIAMALTGCTFFTLNSTNGSENSKNNNSNQYVPITVDWDNVSYEAAPNKTSLKYDYKYLRSHSIYDVDAMPSQGDINVLVIPLWFKDSSLCIKTLQQKNQILDDINTTFFGSDSDTGWESVSSFYFKESYGKCKISGEVLDWQNVNLNASSLGVGKDSTDQIANIINSTIYTWKHDASNTEENIRKYDADNDGYLDSVVLIYGYMDYENIAAHNKRYFPNIPGQDNDDLWAFTYWLQGDGGTPQVTDPVPNTYLFASYDFMYDSNQAEIELDAHTYIHEMGHVLGLDDYYDYSDSSKAYQACGKFSMQDYNIGGHDPYSIMALGWAKPYIPTTNTEITIKPFESSGDVILLPSNNSKSVFDEYILLEMYSPTGVNEHDSNYPYKSRYLQGPQEVGIRIWHVDARLIKPDSIRGDSYVYSTKGITNEIEPTKHVYDHLNTNTTYSPNTADQCSRLENCRDFRLLQLIRKGDIYADRKGEDLSEDSLFTKGDTFSIGSYFGYFKNNKFNNGNALDYAINIKNINNETATIQIAAI